MEPTNLDSTGPRAVDHDPRLAARLLRRYDRDIARVRPVLERRFGADTEALIAETRDAYAGLIPRIPYIGGRGNPLTANLQASALSLAMWRVLRPRGFTPEAAGSLLNETYVALLASYSPRLMHLLGRFYCSRVSRWMWQRRAAHSQRRQYPGDWVFTAVEGDGDEFDYGVDYTECGVAKFFAAEGARDIAPQMCALDFAMSRAFGLGLRRSETLLTGGSRCDFRFKHGRPEVDA